MLILGIDPGTRILGYSLLDTDGVPVATSKVNIIL